MVSPNRPTSVKISKGKGESESATVTVPPCKDQDLETVEVCFAYAEDLDWFTQGARWSEKEGARTPVADRQGTTMVFFFPHFEDGR